MAMITGVQFGFMPAELVERMAHLTVKETSLYDKHQPRRSALQDPRFGPIDRHTLCSTCGMLLEQCPGHCGMIRYAGLPFYYPWGLDYVLKVLSCVCFYCSRLLLPRDSLRCQYIASTYAGRHRLQELVKACQEMKYCGALPKEYKQFPWLFKEEEEEDDETKRRRRGCGRFQPSYKKVGFTIGAHFRLSTTQPGEAPLFNPLIVHQVLKNIDDDDARVMGFNPTVSPISCLMAEHLYVSSNQIRFPTAAPHHDQKPQSEDDITLKYNSMLKLRTKIVNALKNEPQPLRSFHAMYTWVHEKDGTEIDCHCTDGRPRCNCPCFAPVSTAPPPPPPPSTAAMPLPKKKEKREKSIVDLWNEFQVEYTALASGEYRKALQMTMKRRMNRDTDHKSPPGQSSSASLSYASAYSSGNAARVQKAASGLRGIKLRWVGKGGRIRSNLMGKRLNFSARTVICGSVDIDIDEIGIPRHFASILTKQVLVRPFNIHYLTHLLRTKKISRISNPATGEEWHTDYINTDSFLLQPGWIVHRHLQDGDYVQIGRQPSLHRPSTMTCRVRLVDGLAFLLNLALTTALNADYDGDEIYATVPQSDAAVIEAMQLMHVPYQILSPQSGSTLIGFVQHSVLAAYLLGRLDVLFSREQFLQLVNGPIHPLPKPTIVSCDGGGTFYTGKQLFSVFLPPTLQFQSPANRVLIRHGQWLRGLWKKQSLQGLVHVLTRDFGAVKTAAFISTMQRVLKLFLDDYGATIGPHDLLFHSRAETSQVFQQTSDFLNRYQYGPVETTKLLDKAKEYATEKMMAELSPLSNGLLQVIRSGTKGSLTNVLQLMGCLGETRLLCKPIAYPTAHFTKQVDSLAAKGFIASCFATGLTPYEAFYHFAAGREGILDTGQKTPKVGYVQRKLARMLGDVRIVGDGTVRDAEGRVIMFRYGDDFFNPSYVESVRFRPVYTEPEKEYRHPDVPEEYRDYILPAILQCQQVDTGTGFSYSCPLPFHRLWLATFSSSRCSADPLLSPRELFTEMKRLYLRIGTMHYLFQALFWTSLCVRKWPRLPSRGECQRLVELIERRYLPQGLAKAGDTVGSISAQVITEPLMQGTLRTFYLPGLGSMVLQSAFDQLTDLCNATQDATHRTISISLKPQFAKDTESFAKQLQARYLKDVVDQIAIRTEQTALVPCSCLRQTHTLLSALSDAIRPAPFFLELTLKSASDTVKVQEAMRRFLRDGQVELLCCGAWIHLYLDRFHPLFEHRDTDSKITYDLLSTTMMEQILVSGQRTIREAHVVEQGKILAFGSNVQAIWRLPQVDLKHTMTNDIREIEQLYGIDAACLILEDKFVACMKKQDINVDRRHLKVVAANMCRSGRMVPNTSLGVATESQSTLRKGSFEKCVSTLAVESAMGSYDPCRGTVEALIVSALPKMGTSYGDIRCPPPSLASIPPALPKRYADLHPYCKERLLEYHIPFSLSSSSDNEGISSYVPATDRFIPLVFHRAPATRTESVMIYDPTNPSMSFFDFDSVPEWIRAEG